MATSDQLDALTKTFQHKATVVTQECYTPELSKNKDLQGAVTLTMTVQPDGTASGVQVASSTLNDQTVEGCLVTQVSKWHLPTISAAQPWSWTYTFKPF
jgi:hypothetical protein